MSSPATPQQVVFIDSSVPDLQDLLGGLAPGVEAFLIDPSSDGLAQIADILAANDLTDLSSISIVGHGAAGQIQVGSTTLDEADLASESAVLGQIGTALAPDGDLQLYSCDTANGAIGQQFIADLSSFAGGATVAASSTDIGQTSSGENWTLDTAWTDNGSATPQVANPFTTTAEAGFSGTLGPASDPEIWVVGNHTGGVANELARVDDTTGNGSASSFVDLFDPNNHNPSNNPTDPLTNLNMIGFDTEHNEYFIAGSNSSGEDSIYRASISQTDPGTATPTLTEIFHDPNHEAITGMVVDPTSQEIFFTDGQNLYKMSENVSGIQTLASASVTDLGGVSNLATFHDSNGEPIYLDALALNLPLHVAYFTESTTFSTSSATGTSPGGHHYSMLPLSQIPPSHIHNIVTVASNAIYKGTLDANATSVTISHLVDVDPKTQGIVASGTDDNTIATDSSGNIYFTTVGDGFADDGGIYEINFGTSTINVIWQQNKSGTGPTGELSAIVVDSATGKYYVTEDDFNNASTSNAIYVGNLSDRNVAPTLFEVIQNYAAGSQMSPLGMAIDNAPTFSSVTGAGNYALQGGPAVLTLSADGTDADSDNDQGDGAQIVITNAQSGDLLEIGGAQSGTLDGGKISYSYNSTTHTMTLAGTDSFAEYQTVIDSIQFQDTGTDNSTGSHPTRTITYQVYDGLLYSTVTGATTITQLINRAPTLGADSYKVVESNTSSGTAGTGGTGVLGNDSDKDGDSITVTAVNGSGAGVNNSVNGVYGELTLNSDGSFSYVADQTTAINGHSTGSHPVDSFNYTVSDGLNGTSTTTVSFTIDRPPVAAADSYTVVESNAVSGTSGTGGTGVLGNDSDKDGDGLTVTALNSSGANLNSATFQGTYGHFDLKVDGSFTYTADNTTAINSAASGSAPVDTFNYTISDGQGGSSTANVSFTVDRPVVVDLNGSAAGDNATASFTEQTPLVITPSATISSPDSSTLTSLTATLVARPDGNGVESLLLDSAAASLATTDLLTVAYTASTGVLSISGTASGTDYQSILDGIVYGDTSDDPNTASRTVNVVAINSATETSATSSVTISVTAVNDAPVAVAPGTDYSATEQTNLALQGTGLSVSDVDGESGSETVTLSVGEGIITVSAGNSAVTGLTNNGTSAVSFSGTLAELNALLGGSSTGTVVYNDNTDTPSASTPLTLEIDDNDHTGTGGALTDSAQSTIDITAVNDPPVPVTPGTHYSATEQTVLDLKNTGMSVSDVDALGGTETMTLSVGEGTLTATIGDSGATIVGGNGTSSVQISGTIAELNALLGTGGTSDLTYIDNTDTPSASTTLTLTIDDNGNTGTGGPQTASSSSTIDITAVNDAPTVTALASYAGTPNNPITINSITFGDVDSEGGTELATFSVVGGTFNAVSSGGVTIGGSGSSDLTASGTIANLNSFISGDNLTFTGTTNETLGISIDDEGNTGTGLVGGLTASTSANIVVDNPPSAPVDSDTVTLNQVTEGAPDGTYVGLTASSTDVEDGTNLAYSLTANPGGFFAIDSVTGKVSVSAAGATGIDFESSGGAYTITVAATDSDSVATTSNFSINVVDVAPSVPADGDTVNANQVTEGAGVNTYVGLTASSTDPNGGTVTYSLPTNPGGLFQIDSNGAVSVSGAGASGIDFESSGGSYTITVEAADPSGMFNTADFTINVVDAAPSVPADSDNANANQVTEGAGVNTYVGLTASSTDPNGGTVTYSLSSDPGNFFQIDPSSGAVSVSGAGATGIDFESSGGAYTIAVEAADPSGMFNTANFTINVLDVAPSVPTDSDTASANQVTEGAGAGTYVGLTAASMDPNGGTVTYSLSSDPGNLFQIDPSSGAVSVSAAGATGIDFESSGGAYTIAVEAADPSGLFNTANFTINVLDVAPSVPVDSDTANANQVAEGAASGTYVGLTAASMDPNGGAVTYSLSSDPGNFFQIDPSSGAVSVSAAGATGIDFETSGGAYAITVEAADPSGLFNTANFTINVLDVAPTASGFNATTTEAVQGGSPVTLLTAPPPTLGDVNSADLAGATVTISGFQTGDLLSANTAGTNISASYAGGVLTLSGNDTFADYQNVLASVAYQDTGTDTTTVGHASRTFIWTVTDGTLNSTPAVTTTLLVDRPPTQTAHNVAIVESVSTGTVSAGDSDPDGDSVSVTALTGGTVGSPDAGTYGTLTINNNDTYSYTAGNTAAINAAASGIHPTDTFTYTVSDGQGGTALETLTFSIDRLPTSATHNVTLVEGTSTSTATAGDSDPDGDGVTVTAVTGGTVGSPLAGSYGTLTLNGNDTYSYDANNTAAINAAPTNPTDTFTYTISDGHGGTAIETLAFTVTRQPLVTAVAANVNATPSENFAASALFSASSPDGTPINSYQVEDETAGSSQGFWVLNGAVLANGQLTILSTAQLSELSFVAGASASTSVADTLEVAASNAAGLGAFTTFTVTASKLAPGDVAPTVTAASVQIAPNLSVAGSSLFSASVPQGETIVSYEVEDATTDSGHWVFNGVVEPTNQVIDVTVAQLAQLSFDTGYGSDTLKVRANDGTQWGSFTSFTVTPPPNAAPPAGTADTLVMLRNADGAFEFYDIGHNVILLDGPLGQINPALQVAGVGGFNGADTADLLMRDATTGVFTLYDVSNDNITGNIVVGQVGLEWTVSGFGDFSTRANETDMLMRNSNTGQFEVFDIANNAITFAGPMGQVGLEWSIAGFGDFSTRANETDMLMRNSNTGAFEVYDIANNAITSFAPMGQVGLEWTIAGFGDFSTRANETDMLMRNSNTGAFEVYDISNNTITSFAPMGQVGLEWTIAGFGDFSGNANETDMLMRNSNTGVFELYDINNNTIAPVTAPFGQVGLEWSISGVSATPASAPPTTQLSGIATDPAGAAPSSATAQLTQAMASFAPSAGVAATSSPLGQSSPVAETPNLFAAASQKPSAMA